MDKEIPTGGRLIEKSYMKERSFFDTNILIYTDDSAFPEKQAKAIQLLDDGWNSGNIVLSTQVFKNILQQALVN